MKYQIDFSLFSSPTTALGNVSGFIQLQDEPSVGESVWILSSLGGDQGLMLRVECARTPEEGAGALLMLGDCLVEEPELMARLISRIRAETGLYVDVY